LLDKLDELTTGLQDQPGSDGRRPRGPRHQGRPRDEAVPGWLAHPSRSHSARPARRWGPDGG
jgi:hypothetical protein